MLNDDKKKFPAKSSEAPVQPGVNVINLFFFIADQQVK
jgi:hypothetical protein